MPLHMKQSTRISQKIFKGNVEYHVEAEVVEEL